jgi:hypothetical protein
MSLMGEFASAYWLARFLTECSVLNPNNTDDKPEPSASTQDPAFASATSSPDEPFTSGGPDSTTTGASPSVTAGVGKLGVSTVLVVVGAGVFAFGMMA